MTSQPKPCRSKRNQHNSFYSVYVKDVFKKRLKGAKAWKEYVRGQNTVWDMLDCPVDKIVVKNAKGKIVYKQAEGC